MAGLDIASDLAAALLEFVEAVVLHLRQLYKPELYERQRLYGVAVHKSRHPGLNEYIHNVISSLKEVLLNSTLRRVSVDILDARGLLLERFAIQLHFTGLPGHAEPALDPEDLESALRGFLLKLQFADAWMTPLPEGCSFEVVAHTTARNVLPLQQWAEDQAAGRALGLPEPLLTPIKSVSIGEGLLSLQLYVES